MPSGMRRIAQQLVARGGNFRSTTPDWVEATATSSRCCAATTTAASISSGSDCPDALRRNHTATSVSQNASIPNSLAHTHTLKTLPPPSSCLLSHSARAQPDATLCAPSLTRLLQQSGPTLAAQARGFTALASEPKRWDGDGGEAAAREVMDGSSAARMVLSDPVSRLMASQGMPIGISLATAASGGDSGSRNSPSSGAAGECEEDLTRPPRPEPAYTMEAFSDMLRATATSARHGGAVGASSADDVTGNSASSGGRSSGSGGSEDSGYLAGVQAVGPSLDDAWGTTREGPADIARRIVDSNREVIQSYGGMEEEEGDGEEGEGVEALSPSEAKYASLEAMSADIKKLDEVFEVLASVPWLDENVLSEKELKGVAQVGLLGTLEEVGFNIRPQLLRIWAGERGAELAAGPGLQFRDQAAVLAILYHTQQIEDGHGVPPGGYLPAPSPALLAELQAAQAAAAAAAGEGEGAGRGGK